MASSVSSSVLQRHEMTSKRQSDSFSSTRAISRAGGCDYDEIDSASPISRRPYGQCRRSSRSGQLPLCSSKEFQPERSGPSQRLGDAKLMRSGQQSQRKRTNGAINRATGLDTSYQFVAPAFWGNTHEAFDVFAGERNEVLSD